MEQAFKDLPAVKHADVAGVRIAYRVWGEAGDTAGAREPVLLVHGITSSSLSWGRVAPALAKHYRVIAVDNKGHGDSARPETGYRLEEQAAEAEALLEYLDIDRARVIGHSWGGAIATLLAVSSKRVTRLVLEDPALVLSDEARSNAASGFGGWMELEQEAAEARVRQTFPQWPEEDVHWKVDAAVKGSKAAVLSVMESNNGWDLRPNFSKLRIPTLLVRAENELGGIVSPETASQAEAAGLKVITLPGADHSIHRSRFQEFMAIVEAFLRGG